jgi:hypothetical protein
VFLFFSYLLFCAQRILDIGKSGEGTKQASSLLDSWGKKTECKKEGNISNVNAKKYLK